MLTNFSKRLWHVDWRIILALVLLLGMLVGAMGWHAALPSSQVATSQDATIGSSTMWHPNLSQFTSCDTTAHLRKVLSSW
jgi:hypothetical protein